MRELDRRCKGFTAHGRFCGGRKSNHSAREAKEKRTLREPELLSLSQKSVSRATPNTHNLVRTQNLRAQTLHPELWRSEDGNFGKNPNPKAKRAGEMLISEQTQRKLGINYYM